MNKRDFIKTGILGTVGLFSLPRMAKGNSRFFKSVKTFELPALPYAYDALEPFIDKETMIIHHTKHHQAYTDKFNIALQAQSIVVDNVREILQNASKYDETILNNGGGYLNHKMFWKMLAPNGGGPATGKIGEAIVADFGSFENFKLEFTNTAKSLFGSGWVWLVDQKGKLKITATANQENPFLETLPEEKKGYPLLCLDVWEHAYYLKYQNRRAEYIDAFWKIVNWQNVNMRINKSIL